MWPETSEFDEIFIKVLDHLPHKERVRDTVLVCKRWARLCLANPPCPSEMTLRVPNSTEGSYFTWLAKSVGALTKAEVRTDTALLPRHSLAQVLTVLGTCSPRLRTLIIDTHGVSRANNAMPTGTLKCQGWDWENWVGTLRLFRKLDRLDVHNAKFHPHFHARDLQLVQPLALVPQDVFSGMSLQSLSLGTSARTQHQVAYLAALQHSLAALTRLTHLRLHLFGGEEDPDTAQEIARVTSLRSLDVMALPPLMMSPTISDLRNLTSLKLQAFNIRQHQHIGSLSSLKCLGLAMNGFHPEIRELEPLFNAGALTQLTRLEVASIGRNEQITQEELATLLPEASLRRLSGLVHLRLNLGPGFTELTLSRAISTSSLTSLDLGRNGFSSLPPAVSRLTALAYLGFYRCNELQLDGPHPMDIVRALLRLQTLDVRKFGRHKYTAASQQAMNKLREQQPGLEVLDRYAPGGPCPLQTVGLGPDSLL